MIHTNLDTFLEELSSKSPVPGGGGASALGGAIGAALGNMVINLTVGKKKYASVEDEMLHCYKRIKELQAEMVTLIEKDAVVFEPLANAYRLPSSTPVEQLYKENVMEENLLAASFVPLTIMEKSLELIEIHKELAAKGSKLAISDVGVGVQFCKSALLGASMNVFINTKTMKDQKKAALLNQQADLLIAKGSKLADNVFETVLKTIR